MKYIVIGLLFCVLLFFVFIVARQAKRETRYYDFIAEKESEHYDVIEKFTN